MTEYKHIPVYPVTMERFRDARKQRKETREGRFVSDDAFLNELLDNWEHEKTEETP